MAFLVTPKQLVDRSELYHQIGAMLAAGLRLPQIIEGLAQRPPSWQLRTPLTKLAQHLQQGETFSGSVAKLGKWLPAFDLALIEAGETSGRLDQCMRLLSQYYADQAQLINTLIAGLAYPVVLLHFACLIFPLTVMTDLVLKGAVTPFIMAKLELLVPVYGILFLIGYMIGAGRSEFWRGCIEGFIVRIPVFGQATRRLALARLSVALESLLAAGVGIFEAWELAAAASGSVQIKRAVLDWRPMVESGVTPAAAVQASGVFPELFANLYFSGEVSGKLEETLGRLHVLYQDEAQRRFRIFAKWFPFIIYMGVILACAFQVVKFWAGYFNGIGNGLNF
jgi:type II secretory pathway component PulF